jgi:hypothetical protein
MKYAPGTLLFYTPIRYWETDELDYCTVVRDDGRKSLLAKSEAYGHEVFIDRARAFTARAYALMHIHGQRLIYDARRLDDNEYFCETEIAKRQGDA